MFRASGKPAWYGPSCWLSIPLPVWWSVRSCSNVWLELTAKPPVTFLALLLGCVACGAPQAEMGFSGVSVLISSIWDSRIIFMDLLAKYRLPNDQPRTLTRERVGGSLHLQEAHAVLAAERDVDR